MYRKLRFTLRYLLGNVADFDPARDAVPWESLPTVDRHMLHRFALLLDDLADSYAGYQFSRFFQVLTDILSAVDGLLRTTGHIGSHLFLVIPRSDAAHACHPASNVGIGGHTEELCCLSSAAASCSCCSGAAPGHVASHRVASYRSRLHLQLAIA